LNRSEPAARPYAEAVLNLAQQRGKAGAVLEELRAVMEVFRAEPRVWGVYTSPRVNREEKEAIVRKAFGGRVGEETLGLLLVLVRKGREPLFDNILGYFDRMWDVMANRVHVYVRSARPVDTAVAKALEAAVLEASGKTPVMHQETDASLLGGLVVRVNDIVVDGSLKARLRSLGSRLMEERK
jgi:F-type H+-transporting ATPase subunit delta